MIFSGTDFIGDFALFSQPGLVGKELWSSDGTPGHIQLIKDLLPPATSATQSPGQSSPAGLTLFGGRVWFNARTASDGWQLGYSDGTPADTDILVIDPGFPGPDPQDLTAAGDALFFSARSGTELWRMDGAMTGAVKIADGFSVNGIRRMKAVGDRLFFNMNEDLWTSDGTPAGTHIARKINPGGVAFPTNFTAWDGLLYFTANDGTRGRELWRSDGTSNGTVLVRDILPGATGSDPAYLTVYDGALYFAATDAALGRELWRTDGTETGTVMVADIATHIGDTPPGFSYPRKSSLPQHLMVFQGHLYFSADDGIGRTGRELWRTDGTPEGTLLVRNVFPGMKYTGGMLEPNSSEPELVAIHDGHLYFTARTGHQTELWLTDGTSAGTRMARNIYPAEPRPLTPAFGELYFAASDLTHGRELWRAAPTGGVRRVADLFAGWSNAAPYDLTVSGSNLFFSAQDRAPAFTGDAVYGLYVIHETNREPVKLHSFVELGNLLFPPQPLPDGRLLFRARHTNGVEVWVSDGTALGTFEVKDIHPGAQGSAAMHPRRIGDHVWFAASNATGWAVWKSGGTEAGTVMVADLNPGAPDAAPGRFTVRDDQVLFVGFDSAHGAELWAADIAATGAVRLADFRTGASSGLPFNTALMLHPFHVYQGSIYFAAFDGTLAFGLWKSDGTSNGTTKVGAIDPGISTDAGNREEFFEHEGWLYFAGQGPVGVELYRTDGTALELVRNMAGLNPSASFEGDGNPRDFTAVNGRLLFTAFDWTHGREWWTSDGTAVGTHMLKDIHPFRHHTDITDITPVGSNLYFVATEGRFGRELWVTDGTEEGTMIVEDLAPGPMSSNPRHLTVVDGALYYYADAGGQNLSLRRLVPGESPFDAWLAGKGLSGPDAGLFADPNGNGVVNLHEFLLGLEPGSPVFIASPIGIDASTGERLFEFSYDRHVFAVEHGLDTVAEISGDLERWIRAPVLESFHSPLGGDYVRVTKRIVAPLPLPNPLFVRLRHAPP